MTYYEEIFFYQEEAATPFLYFLDKTETLQEEKEYIRKLIDSYWQPGNHMVTEEDPAGPKDKQYIVEIEDGIRAILNVNYMLPYIGLIVEHVEGNLRKPFEIK